MKKRGIIILAVLAIGIITFYLSPSPDKTIDQQLNNSENNSYYINIPIENNSQNNSNSTTNNAVSIPLRKPPFIKNDN